MLFPFPQLLPDPLDHSTHPTLCLFFFCLKKKQPTNQTRNSCKRNPPQKTQNQKPKYTSKRAKSPKNYETNKPVKLSSSLFCIGHLLMCMKPTLKCDYKIFYSKTNPRGRHYYFPHFIDVIISGVSSENRKRHK